MQCRGHWFHPWSRQMPRAAGKLRSRAPVLQQEKALQREARAPRPERSAVCGGERPATREECPRGAPVCGGELPASRESPRVPTETQHKKREILKEKRSQIKRMVNLKGKISSERGKVEQEVF